MCCFLYCSKVHKQLLFLPSKNIKITAIFAVEMCKDNCCFCYWNVQRPLLFLLLNVQRQLLFLLLKYAKTAAVFAVEMSKGSYYFCCWIGKDSCFFLFKSCYFYYWNVQRQLLFLLLKCAKTAIIFAVEMRKTAAVFPVQKYRNNSCFWCFEHLLFLLLKCAQTADVFTVEMCKDSCCFSYSKVQK